MPFRTTSLTGYHYQIFEQVTAIGFDGRLKSGGGLASSLTEIAGFLEGRQFQPEIGFTVPLHVPVFGKHLGLIVARRGEAASQQEQVTAEVGVGLTLECVGLQGKRRLVARDGTLPPQKQVGQKRQHLGWVEWRQGDITAGRAAGINCA